MKKLTAIALILCFWTLPIHAQMVLTCCSNSPTCKTAGSAPTPAASGGNCVGASTQTTGTISCTTTITPPAGGAILCAVEIYGVLGSATLAMSDTTNGAYTQVGTDQSVTHPGTGTIRIYRFFNAANSATTPQMVITGTMTTGNERAICASFTVISAVDVTTTKAEAASGAVVGSTLNPTGNDVLFGISDNGTAGFSGGTWTLFQNGAPFWFTTGAYKITSSSDHFDPSVPASSSWEATTAAFK